jgi:hypothetical protein
MRRTTWISVLLLVACGAPKGESAGDEGEETAGTDGVSETGNATESEGTGGDSVDTEGVTGGSEDSTGCTFLCSTGGEGDTGECSEWEQDCPDGEKCSAYANDGGLAWNSTKCSPVQDDPGQPGDVCTVEGSGVSGIDTCAEGVMCWDVDETNTGVCIALCTGDEEAPICDSGFSCAIANDVLNLCLPDCDPLTQDCPSDNLCIPNGEHFICVLDASGEEGQAFDPCEFGNACDQGLYCMDTPYASECTSDASGCCLPFCDLGGDACPGAGQDCLAWYEEGMAPPGYETVGICGLPQ